MIRTSLLLLASFTLTVATVTPAEGQFSVYGTITVDKLSSIRSSPVLNYLAPPACPTVDSHGNCTAYNNSVNPIGFTGGVSYDFKSFGPITLAADLRGVVESTERGAQTYSDGSGTRIYSGLGGLRASFATPIHNVRPYIQGSGGYARSNYGVLTNAQVTTLVYPGIPTQNNLEYHVFVGTDIRLLPSVDLRLFEIGYGALNSFGTYSHTYPIYSISSGLVFHFPPRP